MNVHLKKWLQSSVPGAVVGDVIQLPLKTSTCKSFLASVTVKRKRGDASGKTNIPNSYSTVNGYINAIKFLHKEGKVEIPKDLDDMLKAFANGYKRQVAKFKENGTMSMQEGKIPLTTEAYRFLAEKALSSSKYGAPVHCFLVLSWNLMTRAESTASIRFDHISWQGDALVIKIGRTKNDQEGKMAWPRHVYANPFEPTICPILSLGLLVFTLGARREGMSALVFDVNVKESFASWLHRICVDEDERMTEIGVSAKDIGTHSLRKGVSTALSNSPAGPQAVSVWLRAGWSLGSVQGRYIFAGAGGDQQVGRAAAGLDMNGIEFAALPPHFTRQALTIAEWEAILPGYRTFYPRGFCSVLPFLLASIVYHAEFLKISLHPSHPFFLSLLWSSGHLAKLKSQVVTGSMRNATSCMIASGIPPHVALSERI
ncbi:hypothetical protein AeRB84_020987 [Aphanomyces euteiches]|nr:hypothetical protein AeRB84_020987 [Aphanomyces euteiches]